MSMRYPGGLIAPTPVNQQYPSGVWTGPQSAPYQANNVWANDSSFKNTTLLLHGDGATRSFTQDASTNNFQITLNGDTKPNNLTPFITNGYWSNYFNGSSTYLSFASNAAFAVTTTADYTVEGWINFGTVANGGVFQTTSNVSVNTGALWFGYYSGNLTVAQHGSATYNVSYAWTPTANVWYHVAATRTSGTVRLFINGAVVTTNASTQNGVGFTQSGAAIGVVTTPSYLTGYLSNVRFVNGTSLYTAAFTPSTTPLTAVTNTVVLACQSNRFVDNSSNAFSITANGTPIVSMQQPFTAPSGTSLFGSGYFDGTGDYLTSPNVAFASNNFTVEGWFYATSVAATKNYWGQDNGAGANPKFILYIEANGTLNLDAGNISSGSVINVAASNLKANAWQHIAIVRGGTGSGQTAMFIDGVRVGTGTLANLSTITAAFNVGYIGEAYGSTFSGYISNFRIVNGTDVYGYTNTTITIPTAPLTPIANTSLLTLQTNGPENNNGFLDSSYNSFPVTRNGNTTQGAFSPYGANWSNAFATSAGIQYPYTSALTSWWTQDFTIEMWVYNNTNAVSGTNSLCLQFAHGNYTAASTYWAFGTNASGQVDFYYYNGGGVRLTSTTAALLGTWNHIAMVYTNSSGNISLYLNGVSVASGTKSGTPQNSSGNTVNLGAVQNTYYNGYISNLRVLNGTALYTGTFTPSTAPLTAITNTQLLTSQSNRFKDNSTNNATPTIIGSPSVQRFSPFPAALQYGTQPVGGSGYFDGTGDYLFLPSNSQTAFQSNNFTIELWVYLTNASANAVQTFYSNYTTFASAGSIFFGKHSNNGGVVTFWLSSYSTGGPLLAESTLPPGNQWVHYAVTRNGNTFSLYRNGVLSTSSTAYTGAATTSSNANYVGVPGDATSLYLFNGYMSDFRIVNGTAVYTGAFTPPTAPLTPIANTALLLPYTNAAIFDNSGMNNLETIGNAQIDTSVVKYGTSSMYFDGSGDYLVNAATPNLTLGSGDFTVECWINLTSVSGTQIIIDSYDGASTGWQLWVGSSKINFYSGTANLLTGTTTLSIGVWYHVAVSRVGTSVRLFLNGISEANTTSSVAYTNASNPVWVAAQRASGPTSYYFGYMDDVRITKGVARYVTNFTPPVARMPNQ